MKKNSENTHKSNADKNYSLKSDAVEELVSADAGNVPEYSQAELKKYRSKHKFHIPMTVKVLFLKAWFCGAVCFFILWGLGAMVPGFIDILFITGIVLGMVTDLLMNQTIRFIEENPGENDKWMLIPPKGSKSLFLNVLYGLGIMICVVIFYDLINLTCKTITGIENKIFLGVEPILFGVFCMGFDLLFIGVKRLIGNIVRNAKNSVRNSPKP